MNHFNLLLELDKQAATQPAGSKGPIRSLTDALWNVGKSAIGGTWSAATAIPKWAWNNTAGAIGSVYKGMANSDGTLGGALQGGFDSYWNHTGDSVNQLGRDLSAPVTAMRDIFARPNAGPRYQAYGTAPQAPHQAPQTPAAAPAPTNPMQAVAQQYPQVYNPAQPVKTVSAFALVEALEKSAAPTNPLFRDTRPMHVQYPSVASHSVRDQERVQRALNPAPPPTLIPEPPAKPVPAVAPAPNPAPSNDPTSAQLAMFLRGTRSKFNPKSRMDQFKMKQLLAGNANWASNPLYWAHAKAASVEDLVGDMPRDVYLEFLADAYA